MDSLPVEFEGVLQDLGQCIEALGPYTQSAVLTGGLAALLYRWCLPSSEADRPPLMTFDIDWALPPRLELVDGEGLHQRMARGNFIFHLQGKGKKPITYYQHKRHGTDRLAPIHAEFITLREGSNTHRSGKNQVIVEVQPQLHAQSDPYLGLLFVKNLELDVSSVPDMRLSTGQTIRLPHPICFVVQKILIRRYRQPHKRASDAAHIYDVALSTRTMWPQMAEVLARIEKSGSFPTKWFVQARQTFDKVFSSPEAPGPREIADIYRNIMGDTTAPTEAVISRVLNQFAKATGLLIH